MTDAYDVEDRDREPDLDIDAVTPASSGSLKAGKYNIYCPDLIDVFFRTGASWGDPLKKKPRLVAGNMMPVTVKQDGKIWALSTGGAAKLEIYKIL